MDKLKLTHQLFIGKVAEIIGQEKTVELLREAKTAIDAIKPNLQQADVSCQREQLLAFAAWLYGNLDKEVERMIVDDYLKAK